MIKFGKTEKPEATEKQPKVKSMLLQTYFTSLLCLVLCVAMFLGTSYAWFTSEVSNAQNEVYIGALDVGLYKKAEPERLDLADSNNKLFNDQIRWEPGFTTVETLYIENKGDLAFKYVLTFTDGKLDGKTDPKLQDVAKNFDIWVYHNEEGTLPESKKYTDITAENSGWVPVGNLAQVLEGQSVIQGKMTQVRDDDPNTPVVEGTDDGVATIHTYTIALHMREDAEIAVMGKKINLSVKLVAYQMSSEKDAFGDDYDFMVATPKDLEEAFQKGGTIALATDVDLSETQVTIPEDVTAILDLNGHNITGTVDKAASLITNQGDLTIQGKGKIAVTFEGELNDGAINAIANRGKLTVNDGEISNTSKTDKQIGYAIDTYAGSSLIVKGGKITASGSSYYDAIRLFCGEKEDTTVTVNNGEISSIWAQNPDTTKVRKVQGTIIVNGGDVENVYYENHTQVKVKSGVTTQVTAFGAFNDKTESKTEGGYTVYRFVQQ